MQIKLNRIASYFPAFIDRKKECFVFLFFALAALCLYLRRGVSIDSSRVKYFTNKNLEAIRQKWYLTRFLIRGSLDKQEGIASKMAKEMGIAFHCFDGRTLIENMDKFIETLKQAAVSEKPQFVFVSYADEVCKTGETLNTLLASTGSVSKKLLLCLGVSSKESLPPALTSRYREQIIIGE